MQYIRSFNTVDFNCGVIEFCAFLAYIVSGHVSKQILTERWNLPICISFSSLHLKMAEFASKLAWKPNEPFRCSITLERVFQTVCPLISANDCCTVLNFMLQTHWEAQGVRAMSKKLQLEISIWWEKCTTTRWRADETGTAMERISAFFRKKYIYIDIYKQKHIHIHIHINIYIYIA